MRKTIVAGNWKMNMLPNEAISMITELEPLVKDTKNEVILCVPYTDLFLYDLKSMDCNQHQKFTGVDNGRILTNLNKLKKNSPIWVRIPCIKNVNDSDKEIEAYCRYLQHADNIQRIELIPYHSYGEHKYKMLGKSVQNFMPMDKQTSQVLQKKLEAQGFQVINYC